MITITYSSILVALGTAAAPHHVAVSPGSRHGYKGGLWQDEDGVLANLSGQLACIWLKRFIKGGGRLNSRLSDCRATLSRVLLRKPIRLIERRRVGECEGRPLLLDW